MKLNHKNVKAQAPKGMPGSLQKIGVFMPEEVFLELVQNQTSRPPLGPVLAAHSNLRRIGALADGSGSVGFGHIAGPGLSVVTIRVQIGAAQIYFLADASCRKPWIAIDTWRGNRQAPVALIEDSQILYSLPEIDWTPGKSTSGIDYLRRECERDTSVPFMEFCSSLAASGIIERRATSDLEGIELSHVEVNILMPERLTKYIGAPLSAGGPPVILLPDSPSGGIH
ncbi:hypothetical protein [Paraburkholderia saeva]|uniref:Uncharacterized protein n=1 Tax=Paraburkholderia saeva TaxID=2777537 RepID=A0A9N8RSL2_9BURK|nr:hypothetical protein [Paraburkholderia saeva]CAG4886699.1 hypothetical protein R70241_00241 [Paraburkholderia saeva]CAG4887240.1 hypothetical protein LMG31841_00377 [Paraburkholderia saeva]